MTAFKHLRQVADWRQLPKKGARRLVVPACTENRSMEAMLYPPTPGRLPGYTIDLDDETQISEFFWWLKTLSGPDRVKIEMHMEWRHL